MVLHFFLHFASYSVISRYVFNPKFPLFHAPVFLPHILFHHLVIACHYFNSLHISSVPYVYPDIPEDEAQYWTSKLERIHNEVTSLHILFSCYCVIY